MYMRSALVCGRDMLQFCVLQCFQTYFFHSRIVESFLSPNIPSNCMFRPILWCAGEYNIEYATTKHFLVFLQVTFSSVWRDDGMFSYIFSMQENLFSFKYFSFYLCLSHYLSLALSLCPRMS